jgi:malate dehydrogenase
VSSTVAIIGAGELGGALAHRLAARDQFAAIRLIDDNAGLAAGKALDVQQAGAVEGFRTKLTGSPGLANAAGAELIVIADRAGSEGEWRGEAGLAVLKRLAEVAPAAVFVCAGGSQRALVARGVAEARISPRRLIGSAPFALASAIRALVALEVNRSAADVSLTVLGVPPEGIVVPWTSATIAGSPAHSVLSPPQLTRIAARVTRLWPPGPYALASAAVRICDGVAGCSLQTYPCFVVQEGRGSGITAAALPVGLGPEGVRRIEIPGLSVQESVALDSALARMGE